MGKVSREAEREEVLRMLQEGMDALSEALSGIEESVVKRRPREDSWSVLECVEHIALVEWGLLPRLREAKDCGESREDRAREAKFQALALNRERRIEAPEIALPGSGSTTLAEALEELNSARRATIRFVEEFRGDLRWWVTVHPLITRPVNCHEMLLLIAMHPKRHAMQIAEIRRVVEGQSTVAGL